MGNLTFTKRNVRGGIYRIESEGRFIGEIHRRGLRRYAVVLPGVCWSGGAPGRSGNPSYEFATVRAAKRCVENLHAEFITYARDTCLQYGLEFT